MTPEKKSYFFESPILFLSTVSSSSKNCVALVSGEIGAPIINKVEWVSEQRQSQELLSHVEDLLSQEKQSHGNLQAIGVHTGPGSFTGIRGGVTIGNALAYALQKPIFGIDTFDFIAHILEQEKSVENNVLVLVPGIKQLSYAGHLEKEDHVYRLTNVFNGTDQEIAIHYKSINPLSIRKIGDIDFSQMITYFVQKYAERFSEKFSLNTHIVQPTYGAPANVTIKSKKTS